MIKGSFLRAIDVPFSGNLRTGVTLDEADLAEAFKTVRIECYHQDALYQNMRRDDFGQRLRALVNQRCRDYAEFARDIGVNLSYIQAMFEEPLAVSNPGARLLQKMASVLRVTVSDLIGDSSDADPILEISKAEWWRWVRGTSGIDGSLATKLRDDWIDAFDHTRTAGSARSAITKQAMKVDDWQTLYDREKVWGKTTDASNPSLFS